METTKLLKKVIETVNVVGEDEFLKNLEEIQHKNQITIQRLAVIIAEYYKDVNSLELASKIVIFPRKLTVAKHIFIFLAQKHFRTELKKIGYNRQTIFRIKQTIQDLLPSHPEHLEIINQVKEIEQKLLNV